MKRLIRYGRRIVGGVYQLADGREVFLAWRKQNEVYRGGEKTASEAYNTGKAAWALDEETILQLRLNKVDLVGVLVKETRDIYLTTLANYLDKTKARTLNFQTRGGSMLRGLQMQHFRVLLGSVRIK